MIASARKLGIPFVLSCDAHSTTGVQAVEYALMMARRGGLKPNDVLNTLPAHEFSQLARP